MQESYSIFTNRMNLTFSQIYNATDAKWTLHRNLFERTTTTDSREGSKNLLKYRIRKRTCKIGMGHYLHNMFYCLQAPFGIPNVPHICHSSSYHPSSLPTYLLGMILLFFISNLIPHSLPFKLTLKTYYTNLPHKPTSQTYPTNLPYNLAGKSYSCH